MAGLWSKVGLWLKVELCVASLDWQAPICKWFRACSQRTLLRDLEANDSLATPVGSLTCKRRRPFAAQDVDDIEVEQPARHGLRVTP